MQYTNHQETWMAYDRDGGLVKTVTLDGWEGNEADANDELAELETQLLWRDEDGEGQFNWDTGETTVWSALCSSRTTTITWHPYDDREPYEVGSVVYHRECEAVEE